MYTTINSTYTLPMPTANLSTKIQSHGVTSVDKFTFSGTTASRYEQAVIDTVKFLGFMSLKNGDHAASGPNPASTKRIIRDAIATRKAADTLLASGAIVLLGTWSNGIAVGPGAGFVPVSHTKATPITAAQKSRKQHTNPRGTAAETVAYNAECLAAAEEKMTGDYCDMIYADGPSCSIGPVVTPAVAPPGVMLSSFHATCNNGALAAEWHCIIKRAIRAAAKTEQPAQPVTDAPTPIRAMPAYTAAAGDTVSLTYSHENGTTTDRVVTIHRMTASGFRGYDHTYRKARNYHFDHITRLTLHTGEEDIAAG